nr:hypothetical protein [Mycoplasmopsis bovis]
MPDKAIDLVDEGCGNHKNRN